MMQSLRVGVLLVVATTSHACTRDASQVDVDMTAMARTDTQVRDARPTDARRPEARADATVMPDAAGVGKW